MNTYVASHLKYMNRQQVYQLIKNTERISKAEITKQTGISPPTVIKIINFLLEKELVVMLGEVETAIGRRPHMLQINTRHMYAVSFVLEGDFLSMGIVDILGKVLCKDTIRIKPDYSYIMERIKRELIDDLLKKAGISRKQIFGLGIALPVIYDDDKKLISNAPLISREDELSMVPDMEELSSGNKLIVMVENDTNAQAIGEFRSGGYREKDDILFVSIGTGLGAGLILDGKLRRGSRYMCGEIGSTIFDLDYRYNGQEAGWLENVIGQRSIEKNFGINVINSGRPLSLKEREEICHYMDRTIALCIHNINACLDCKNVILGGKMVEALGQPLIDSVNRCLSHMYGGHTPVCRESSEDVGLVGMAWLLIDRKIREILMEGVDG